MEEGFDYFSNFHKNSCNSIQQREQAAICHIVYYKYSVYRL